MRKLCIFGIHHQFQFDQPMNGYFASNLRALIDMHRVDTICEEATGLPPKSCVERLADELGIQWRNIDLTRQERKLLSDRSDVHLQDLELQERREKTWVVRISEAVTESGLLICGVAHALSMAQRLKGEFQLEVHIYDPVFIYAEGYKPNIYL